MNTYTKEEAMQASKDYFGGDELASEVFVNKYAMKNKELAVLEKTPKQTHKRLAKEFARIESQFKNPMTEQEIFELFDGFKYIVPQGSPMFGIGNKFQKVSLSNCFVIKTVDSYGGICRADERLVQISKRRGGVGIDISPIRPKGMNTNNSSLTTDGIVLFMERYSRSIREVGQSGRRGALMISISVHHPEVMNFIRVKRDLQKVTGANISVRVTNEFMMAVKNDRDYELRWPVNSKNPSIKRKVKAKEVWDTLVESNYMSAEPGILFWDNIITNSPADSYVEDGFETISTNPCGELPLCENDSCRLMVLNLASYIQNPFTEEATFDIELFREHVAKAQRLMDDLVEMEIEAVNGIIAKIEKDPEDEEIKRNELSLWTEIRDKCAAGRRTGLGITALGDATAMMGLIYGEPDSLKFTEKVYRTLRDEAYRSSVEMAKERGAFSVWNADKEKDNKYLNRLPADLKKEMAKVGRRNIGLLTTAPAGSISVLTQTSSGFEPVFKAQYFRKRKLMENDKDEPDFIDDSGDGWKEYAVYHHGLKRYMEATGKEFKDSPYNGAEANSIDHHKRVEMQAVATKFVDHAISSTVNLPSDVSKELVSDLYMEAWSKGCKGLTIYRDGSRDGVLTGEKTSTRKCEDCTDATEKMIEMIQKGHRPEHIIPASAPKRFEVLPCDIHRSKVGGGDWLFFVGIHNNQPYEVFGGDSAEFTIPHKYRKGWIQKNGKVDGVTQYNLILGSLDDDNEKLEFKGISKHFNNYEYGAFTRTISLSVRHGVPIKYICEQITKKGVEGDLFSFQRAMARIMKKYISEGEKSGLVCPDCSSTDVVYKNGCPTCMVCGYSNCS